MIFLSSFPRSGNTFLRNILFEVYGLESGDYSLESSNIPGDDLARYPVVKTHELPSSVQGFKPGIPAVYLVRDGRDSICSIAHHRSDLVEPGSDYLENLKEAIIAAKGSFFGGWSRNVEDWLERADLLIRFEDLIRDPIATVEKIRKIYPLPKPVIENLPTFNSLKFGIPKYGPGVDPDASDEENVRKSGKFFRKGQTGGWKEEMPDELHDLFWSYHGETMKKLGYSRSGERHALHPEFDHQVLAKIGNAASKTPSKKYRVLIESDKIVSPDNDGVKRYQIELLKSFLPVVENPDSNWQIDLFIQGEIKSLLESKDIVTQVFSKDPTANKFTARLTKTLLATEHKLAALIPRRFVKFLADKDITVLHTVQRIIWRTVRSPVRYLQSRKSLPVTMQPITNGGIDADKIDAYDLLHLPLKQHFSAFKKTEIKTVITIHDLTHRHMPNHHLETNISGADEGMKFATDRQAHLIAVSQSTKNDLLDSTPVAEQKIHQIYEAADRNKFNFKTNGNDCFIAREKYKINFSEPYIICLSTLEPRKNLINTISAYILMRQEHPDLTLKLVVAGKKGWGFEEIFTMAKDYNDYIYFTGFVDDGDLAYLYSTAVALSYVSFYEGFGLPPLEAMCCGTPVIYGNNSAMLEVVADGGLAADPNDVIDIKTQYERMFYDTGLRKRKSRAALKQSLKFSWRDTAISTLDLYKEIIDENV